MSRPAAAAGRRHIDLHLHSNASDGVNTPEAVVHAAHAAGLEALALTDHDTMDGVPLAQNEAASLGLTLVPGVELSAHDGSDEVHMLGLHIRHIEVMQQQLAVFREARRDRAREMVNRLNAAGVRITFDDVLAEAGYAAIGRPHVARALVQNGWALDLRDAFLRYLGAGRPAYVGKRRLGVDEAVALVHRCGGIAVLAHPASGGSRELVQRFVEMGLDGVEVLHPSHGAEDRARLLALVEHFGLVPSGGSDSHGGVEGARVIGAMRVPPEWLDRQEERAAAVRAGNSGGGGGRGA